MCLDGCCNSDQARPGSRPGDGDEVDTPSARCPQCNQLTVVDAASGAASASRWVYVKTGNSVKRFRTDGTGTLFGKTGGQDSDLPASYSQPSDLCCDETLEVYSTETLLPIPDAILMATPTCFRNVTAQQPASPGQACTLSIPGVHVALTKPAEISLWLVLWEPEEAEFLTKGLDQGAAAWTGGSTNATEDGPANTPGPNRPQPADGTRERPRERGLLVKGTIEGAATGAKIRVLNSAAARIDLKDSRDATATVDELDASMKAASGGTRGFSRVVYFADPSEAFGPVHIVVESVGISPHPVLGAFFVHFAGAQGALVNDTDTNRNGRQPGPIRTEADEKIVIDFLTSSQSNVGAITAQTRVRRMIQYPISFRSRQYSAAIATNVAKPEMPMWMAECQIVGITQAQLAHLLKLRNELGVSSARAIAFSLSWTLDLKWDGPDSGGGANHYHYSKDLTGTQTVTLNLSASDDIAGVTDGAAANAIAPTPSAPSFPVTGRRAPKVFVDGKTRGWGRQQGAAARPSLVMEWPPALTSAGGDEIMRGGDGDLKLSSLSVDGTRVDHGKIPDAGAYADPPSDAADAEIPTFRVPGETPNNIDDIIDVVVQDFFDAHAADDHVAALTLACWQSTMRSIIHHESIGDHQFDHRTAGRRRYAGRYFGHERGMPIFGPPHGYGLGQLDNPRVTDDGAWSFIENIRASVTLLMGNKARAAFAMLDDHLPAPLDHRFRATLQRETVRRYNGGREFSWNAAAAQWRIHPSLACADPHNPAQLNPRLNYPNAILGTGIVYGTAAPAPTCNWPITLTAANFGPDTAAAPP